MNKQIKILVENLFNDDIFNNDNDILSELNVAEKMGLLYIDLGLPSGTLWCDRNLGAKQPYEYGNYYQWGDIKGYTLNETDFKFSIKKYKFYKDRNYMKYCTSIKDGLKDNKKILDLEDDAAYNYTKGEACMPNIKQCKELLNNCEVSFETIHNYKIAKFTSKINNNSIIFPLSGIMVYFTFQLYIYDGLYDNGLYGKYWTSDLTTNKDYATKNANIMYIREGDINTTISQRRESGLSIRPIMLKNKKKRK